MSEKPPLNKKQRNIVILFALILLALILYLFGFFTIARRNDAGPERPVICFGCENRCILNFKDINSIKCPKCEGRIGIAHKCKDCQFEFPFVYPEIELNEDPESYESALKATAKCPNCKSNEIAAISKSKFEN